MTSNDRPDPLDPLEALRTLRPTTRTIDDDWPRDERDDLRAEIVAEGRTTRPPRFVARSRNPLRRVALPAAAAAVAVLMAGVLLTVLRTDGDGDLHPAGDPFTASSVTATPTVGAHQYANREVTTYELRNGRPVATDVTQDWVNTNGTTWSYRADGTGRRTECYVFPHQGEPNFQNPSKAWFDSLPTGTDALREYMRSHVDGSTSRDEAVFVAVGDSLRAGDLLATSRLRAAMVEVLSRTGGVAVHRDVLDSRDRPAVRADFVDPRNRPGELSSLYFDPRTFQLVEEASRTTAPTTYSSQSYEVAPPSATTADRLPPAAGSTQVTVERVAGLLPARVQGCPVQN